jgi:hypothetical protein
MCPDSCDVPGPSVSTILQNLLDMSKVRFVWSPRMLTPFGGSVGFNFSRRILGFMKRIQEHFSQESLRGSITGIVKQDRRTCKGNIVLQYSKEVSDTAVGWQDRVSCVLGFGGSCDRELLATQSSSHRRNLCTSDVI